MEEPLIISDPKVMVGKPIIRGTRITVEHILNEIANRLSIEQILAEYPHLTRQGVIAALRFAASRRFSQVLNLGARPPYRMRQAVFFRRQVAPRLDA
jgi:uncharacterized protein (DUF433 family)